ncbi:4-hydroxy-tetrahydrodipicolinate synthase [Leptospira biflexa]|uniref:4-hydroxy-tetrahydrodipicolinate synthase n=2 Tax=Leptospira biflexa serovar Patoc TaxID=145259 RepID=DAPA_LEPBP|nr:4-hydroxy-tetrahydrodipicolinate synthase [Leptospira biflexa]B0SCT0.1 RecName: Full=4-hydroxy-tetrahydrodipicolinate synthase; Short=HTPA synthase [Leptospira biflexa serovar Patoc strain 'Patoc 1 (Ames)']B0SL58.1 RecName: Full=4-hydroxy-tetrahydrodipicolinate synthase; Short=HTPA synthase [Leptospira biflexa serovar Patoc strain 'Patoc 1 (Paris)']ABZ93242.1 Dihydrodipicolinate synthase/N-acetylneuraminate lyase [Leptospira biflexa serovar Patoc strain 'Patoc 1 (Ames)']ABZ96865.1 Dihydrodip
MFQGVYTAVITPFRQGKIDYDSYFKILENQIRSGVAGVVPCGTTGESPTLSYEEHKELIQKTVQVVSGKIQVIAGTGSNSTKEAIELTESACADGVDGILSVNPYYNKPTQEGMFQHFTAIANVSSKPVMLYNIPGRTNVNLLPETVSRLAAHPKIAAIKEATGDLGQMAKVISQCPTNFDLLSGDDNLTLPVLSIGGKGVVSVVSNLFPRACVDMVSLYLRGDLEASKKIYYKLLPVFVNAFIETNPIPIKAAMSWFGYCSNELRLPMTSLSEGTASESFKKIVFQLKEEGIV